MRESRESSPIISGAWLENGHSSLPLWTCQNPSPLGKGSLNLKEEASHMRALVKYHAAGGREYHPDLDPHPISLKWKKKKQKEKKSLHLQGKRPQDYRQITGTYAPQPREGNVRLKMVHPWRRGRNNCEGNILKIQANRALIRTLENTCPMLHGCTNEPPVIKQGSHKNLKAPVPIVTT